MAISGRRGGNRFFLNALREDLRSLTAPDTGTWRDDSLSMDFLAKYASDIYLSGQLADPRVAHSVPSVFARPIQFYQALREERNPLHKVFVSEWRGLLALVGLQSWMGLDVKLEKYEVPPEDPNARSSVGDIRADDLHLGTMLRKQLPQPESDWARWWLIYCSGELIGATSPWTIVFTPAQYSCPESLYWRDENRLLIDPIQYFDPRATGRSDELAYLFRWLELVLKERARNWDMPKHLDPQLNVISRRLEDWRQDLERYRREDVKIERLASFPLVEETPYRHFLTPPPERLAIGSAGESELAIRSTKLGDSMVLALARKELLAGGRVYRSVLVNQVDLTNLPAEGPGFRSKGGTPVPLPYVFVEEIFLPPKLVELPLASPAMRRGSANFALPLNPAFFKYFDHRDLADTGEMLQIAETDTAVRVMLRIPLKGGEWLKVNRTYDRATEVIRLEGGTPAFGIWPDFYAEDWHENFAAYAGPAEPKRGIPDFRAAPLFGDGTTLTPSKMDGTEKPVRIWHCTRPPIGFALSYRNQDTNEVFAAGVLLLERLSPPTNISKARTWDVGVDFGTSSTVVTVRRDGGRIELLPFVGRAIFLTTTASDRHEAISYSLYSAEGATPPFQTLLYQSDATVIGGGSDEYRLRFVLASRSQPVSDVKWGTNFKALTDYLKELLRYIGCEARSQGAGILNLHYSFPLSLPEGQREAMTGFWESVKNSFEMNSVIKVMVEPGIPESDAICRCLAEVEDALNIRAETLTVAVDVGGGSTDIGFWTEKNLWDQVSFKLAGNDVLNSRLMNMKNSDLLGMLFRICTGVDIPEPERAVIERRTSIYLNWLLSGAKGASGKMFDGRNPRMHPVPLAIHGGKANDPPWIYLRTMSYLFFMGVSYYIGLHARKRLTSVPEVTIYYGGRGCSLLAWLTGDEKKAGEILNDAFQQGFGFGGLTDRKVAVRFAGPALDFNQELPALKLEVALGLLSPPLGDVSRRSGTTLLGEVGWSLKGNRVEWDREITVEDLALLKPPENHRNGFAGFFLEHVLPMHPELNLDMDNLRKLKMETGAIQEGVARAAEKDRVSQPLFAFELKSLMSQYANLLVRP